MRTKNTLVLHKYYVKIALYISKEFKRVMPKEMNEYLFPNSQLYETNTNPQNGLAQLLKETHNIDTKLLGQDAQEQQKALATIQNWVKNLWQVTVSLVESQTQFLFTEKQVFYQDYIQKLQAFITHKDHGIVHSFCVYSGMLYLSEKNKQLITPGSSADKQLQLLALLHDITQTVPFAVSTATTKPGHLLRQNQKNEHARSIAAITRIFGTKLGFDQETTRKLAFGLQKHDASYSDQYYPEQEYLCQLLHDADKLFGASISKDIREITQKMLERNYQANRGPSGSYLIRTELSKKYREKIKYGDRCFNDVSLVRKEFKMRMYTKAGKKIAQERRAAALASMQVVYGNFFDLTHDFIYAQLQPELGKSHSHLVLSITGMDQEEVSLSLEEIPNIQTLFEKFETLYNTPIVIKNPSKQIADRYNLAEDARGLKIRVLNTTTNADLYLDPSIARFCFQENGRENFLQAMIIGLGLEKAAQRKVAASPSQTTQSHLAA